VNAEGKKLQQNWGMQTYTADNQSTEKNSTGSGSQPELIKSTCSSSYDDSFSVFFYACASQFYDASFSYHKAYSNIFLNRVYKNKFQS
jgi:hypothetical protein